MKVLIAILFTLFLSLSAFAVQAQASGSCTGMYGEQISDTCSRITVDKKVLKPGTNDFIDGLSPLDPKYHANDTVNFKIIVRNDGQNMISEAEVVDALPANVTFISGPGNYDKDAHKLTFKIYNLQSGQSQEFAVAVKVISEPNFGDNQFMCLVNNVRATEKNGNSAEDSAQFCVERPIKVYAPVPVKQAPSTGPEAMALPLLASMAGAGMFLRRKVRI